MADTAHPTGITLRRYTIHRIPTDGSSPIAENTQGNNAVAGYIAGLLELLNGDQSKRTYSFADGSLPEAKSQIVVMLHALENHEFSRAAEAIAKRLQMKQMAVQGGAIEVQDGVLLCADMDYGGNRVFLLAKLEFVDFLNEQTWQHNQGVPVKKNRPLKACCCRMAHDDQTALSFDEITVYDSNSTIARFWWNDFLELTEETSDQTNSKRAYEAWLDLLTKRVKTKSTADFFFLRNGIQFQFQTRPAYDHEKIVAETLDNYKAVDSTLNVKELAAAARAMPSKFDKPGERFDTRFNIDVKACRIRITRMALTEDIQLVIKGGLEDLRADVRAAHNNNQRGVFVVSESGYRELTGSKK